MAALTPLSQLLSGNPAYESLYRQVDPANTGRVGAAEAAQFLKKSGLSDSTLGQIWDLSDPDRKGYLDKKGFFTALRLVASAQGGSDVSLNSLSQNISAPMPKFRDAGSPSLNITGSSADSSWTVKPEDKAKYDGIFESLSPIGGLLSGDKVKLVLMNSNLPLDVLGKIWDLSDIDKDGSLDKDEFSVAMHLVYAAREKEPVPSSLPTSLIPPSKRKKIAGALPGSVPVLPSSPFLLKENLRPTPALSKSPLGSSTNLSPSNSFNRSTPTPPQTQTQASSDHWVVPADDREQYEEIFELADSDFDGMVGGGEVKDIFMNSRLPQSVLAHIWSLADTKGTGKLTKEQFCLAMHLIQERVKGVEPPKSLTPEMIPPSERGAANTPILSAYTPSVGSELTPLTPLTNFSRDSSSSSVGKVELLGIKDLDDISQEISQLQSEKRVLETEIRQKEEVLRQRNSEIQEEQRGLERENVDLQELEHQKRDAQDRLNEMEMQRVKLQSSLDETKSKWQEENAKISSLQTQIMSQESNVQTQEKEMSRTKTDLYCLEQEEERLEDSLRAGKAKLDSILKLLKTSQDEMDQTRSELSLIQESQRELNKSIERYSKALTENMSLTDLEQIIAEEENNSSSSSSISSSTEAREDSLVKSRMAMFNSGGSKALGSDPFQSEDPFKSDLFSKADPFGGDPFKQNDPFKDPFANSDPFGESSSSQLKASPFTRRISQTSMSPKPKDSDPFAASDPFSGDAFGGKGGFADFSQMSKSSESINRRPTYPLPPPKKPGPQRPAPPPYVRK
ncbi:epidermal growth factor receptor substrate 15-like 1 isoform X3 [Danio rerio]|uniref:Epidermal growth factor receptor substrate 15-like 1 isoform X3 n=1 Tax=Danio rerio TaxID=7955 RepID=A0AC58I0W5_DANRE|nr:epidermal growth factor receptor substrate 15-like 1 isoform X2 [Danio rerio]|eukprot:XP_021323983.1 epidermal growth factor receptor substrate 15-like 1 isoform X2 [Danio rerio]